MTTVTQVGAISRTAQEPNTSAAAARHALLSRGDIFYVDSTNGLDTNPGTAAAPFKTLAVALAALTIDSTLFVARGGYTGDFATQINADAPFTSILGLNQTDKGFGPFLASSTSSEPTISGRARGMRISGLEFDCPALDAGIELRRVVASDYRPDFLEVDHCLFTGGKFGIDQNGGSTYIHVHHNIFDLMSVAAGSAISATNTDHQLPGRWRVENNEFLECVAGMDMNATVGSHGFNSSVIGPGNVFQAKGQARDTSPVLDIQGGAGNLLVGNYLGMDITAFKTTGTLVLIGNNDRSAGNHLLDGEQDGDAASP